MNPTPIPGSVNEKGIFTAKNNPIVQSEYAKDKWCYPQLFCYTPSNVLVTDEEHVEVRLAYRYKGVLSDEWAIENNNAHKMTFEQYKDHAKKLSDDYEVEQVYITIPPTEKVEDKIMKKLTQKTKTALYENHIMMSKLCDLLNTSTNIIKEMAVGNGNSRLLEDDVLGVISYYTKIPISELTEQQTYTNPLPDTKQFKAFDEPDPQPLEGVKTAEAQHVGLSKEYSEHANNYRRIDAVIDAKMKQNLHTEYKGYCLSAGDVSKIAHAMYEQGVKEANAQFATDAGGEKMANDNVVMAAMEKLGLVIAGSEHSKQFLRGAEFGANWQAKQAPSTHSSSEMVGVEKVNVSDLQFILNMSDEIGRTGCTYGDTQFDSVSAAYGSNETLHYIQDKIRSLINK